MPASTSFAFNGDGKLAQTVVLFPDSDPTLVAGLLQGIHGKPPPTRPSACGGTIITAVPAGRGTMLIYRPAGR